jgi:hypothetical protein
MSAMPSFRLRAILLAAWVLAWPVVAGADTAAKPGELTTALPPVALSREQADAIAAKGTPAPRPIAVHAAAAKGVLTTPAAASASHVPAASVTSAQMAAKLAIVARGARALSLPLISPALGAIPRPQWSDPFSLKHGDIAIVGGRRVVIPHPASGAPREEVKR